MDFLYRQSKSRAIRTISMKIGIDISQIAYEGTGVGNFVENLVKQLITVDRKNEYVLFFSSRAVAIEQWLLGMLTTWSK